MPNALPVTWSWFENTKSAKATHYPETWPQFAARLMTPATIEKKEDIGLFCGTRFSKATQTRNLACADVTCLLVLDFDNSQEKLDAAGKNVIGPDGKNVKECIADPVQISLVQAMLTGREYVIATSHSHTADWPRYRVVLPLAAPVPSASWQSFSHEAVCTLGFDMFNDLQLDHRFNNPVQIYYLPSCPPGAPSFFHHGQGKLLVVDPTRVRAKAVKNYTGDKTSKFSPSQIRTYWAHVLPEMEQTQAKDWKTCCPIHGGTNPNNFCVDSSTGLWICYSGCSQAKSKDETKVNGGSIYGFHIARYKIEYKEAAPEVHAIIGGEPGANYTAPQLQTFIQQSAPAQLPEITKEIAFQPDRATRTNLVQQLITTHPQIPLIQVEKEVESHRKIRQISEKHDTRHRTSEFNQSLEERASNQIPDEYGLRLRAERYKMDETGISRMEVSKDGRSIIPRLEPPISDKPIWTAAMGNDLATDTVWVKLCWKGSRGKSHAEWHPSSIITAKDGLLGLNDSPVSIDNVAQICGFLRHAKTTLDEEFETISSSVGWVGPDPSIFIMPNNESITYVGKPIKFCGNAEGWCEPIKTIVSLGESAYAALVALALSCASPLVRGVGRRNPTLGLVAESSTGKNMVIDYATSIWAEPSTLRLGAVSSAKGGQDLGFNRPDFPLFQDEMQQILNGRDGIALVEAIMYFLGSGFRRTTSSRNQTAVGGERRWGASFYASEVPILSAIQGGAQNRVVELIGHPIPNDYRLAARLATAAGQNYGVMGEKIAEILNADVKAYLMDIEVSALEISDNNPGLRGDDAYVIGLVEQGLLLLQIVTEIKMPILEVTKWFTARAINTRTNTLDSVSALFVVLLETLVSAKWETECPDVLTAMNDGTQIAWRLTEAVNPSQTPFEINPTSNLVVNLLRSRNQTERIAGQWVKRGWLQPQATNNKWSRRAPKKGAGAKAWRVTLEGLKMIGYGADLKTLVDDE